MNKLFPKHVVKLCRERGGGKGEGESLSFHYVVKLAMSSQGVILHRRPSRSESPAANPKMQKIDFIGYFPE